ncbi:ribonuclease E inhibitor RraA/Dimethylmenaquinone methyltransferase [Rhizoctonia solani]|nr:ribonuclease E inhibitor RraA/Dimethylmenaquinone methyltransferase [Rhizoctonia solani]
MPDSASFDVWIWNSAHPEQPSRSRPNTRAPSTFPRARKQRADASPVTSPDSSFSSPPYSSLPPPVASLPKNSSRKQKLNVHDPRSAPSTSTQSLLQQFENFSTGEILYALITLGLTQDSNDTPIQHGGLLPDVYMLSPLSINPLRQTHRICGYAYTIEMINPTKGTQRPAHTQYFLQDASRESIIVASLPNSVQHIAWDKFMTIDARNQGALGTIVNGLATDLVDHREAGFSVFAQGYSPRDKVTTAVPSKIHVPVIFSPRSHFGTYFKDSLSAVKVFPGDIIVADVAGAVCVPIDLAEEVLNFCRFPVH